MDGRENPEAIRKYQLAVAIVAGLTGTPCLWSSFAQTNVVRVNYAVGADEMWQAESQPVHRDSRSEGDGYVESD